MGTTNLPGAATGRRVCLGGDLVPFTALVHALARLTGPERDVLELRLGFGQPARSAEATARRLGLSEEQVRAIEAKASSKLRHPSAGLVKAA